MIAALTGVKQGRIQAVCPGSQDGMCFHYIVRRVLVQILAVQILDSTNPGQYKPGQSNPGQYKPWTVQTLDRYKPWAV